LTLTRLPRALLVTLAGAVIFSFRLGGRAVPREAVVGFAYAAPAAASG